MYGSAAWYLIAAAVGYWVLQQASREKKALKAIGQIVGALMIILSFISFTCKVYYVSKWTKGYVCPAGPKCPFTSQKVAQ